MLIPVTLPLPIAAVVLLALIGAILYSRTTPPTPPPAAPEGRHRLGVVKAPYRPTPPAPWSPTVADIEPITRELAAVA